MPDLNIITCTYRDSASVNAESPQGKQWLADHVLIDPHLMTFHTTIEGAQEIERDARGDGLMVETR